MTKSRDAETSESHHKSSEKVWFPEGRWFDWFTGEEHQAGSSFDSAHDLNSFPLFARGGYPILMQPYTERMTSTPLNNVIIRYFPGKTGQTESTSLYEDDGETRDYLQGDYSLTNITTAQDDQQLTIKIVPQQTSTKTANDLNPSYRPLNSGPTTSRSMSHQPVKWSALVYVNGVGGATSVNFDSKQGINHVEVPLTPTGESITVTIDLPEGNS